VNAPLLSALTLAAACTAVLVLFLRGSRRPAPQTRQRAIVLGVGLAVLVAAQSPMLDGLAARSFAWHMVQHLLLIALAAPLIVLADPLSTMVAGLRPGTRAPVTVLHRGVRAAGLGPAAPAVSFGVHMGTVVAWHVPPLFDAAVGNVSLHALEHISLFATALLFWAPVLTTRGIRRIGEPAALVYLVAAGFVGSALGALLTLSSTPWYAAYVAELGPAAALHDQQLAGLAMWMPAGVLYIAVAAVVFWRWLERAQALEHGAPGAAAERARVSEDSRAT
jgi:putative membrane protein